MYNKFFFPLHHHGLEDDPRELAAIMGDVANCCIMQFYLFFDLHASTLHATV